MRAMKILRLLWLPVFLFVTTSVVAQDAVWTNPALEKKGVTGEAFQVAGRGDIADCELTAAKAARRAVPVASAPPGFMGGWRESTLQRDRLAKEREFMIACMSEKGWALQQK